MNNINIGNKELDIKKVLEDIMAYALVLMVIFECYSMVEYRVSSTETLDTYVFLYSVPVLLLVSIILGITDVGRVKLKINRNICLGIIVPEILFIIYYVSQVIGKVDEKYMNEYVFHFVIAVPLFYVYIYLIDQQNRLFDLLHKMANVMFVYALFSIVIYLCVYLNFKNMISDKFYSEALYNNFYNWVNIGGDKYVKIKDFVAYRNFGLFTEPGTFAIPLLTSLYTELFLRKDRYSILKSVIITIAVLTSGGTLPIIWAAICWGLCYVSRQKRILSKQNIVIGLLIAGFTIFMIVSKASVKGVGAGTSFGIHLADLTVGLKAVREYPIFGVGYQGWHALKQYLPESLRGGMNFGYTSLFMYVLGTGGIYFCILCFLPYCINIASFFKKKYRNVACFFIGMFIVAYLVCFAYKYQFILIISLGYYILAKRIDEPECNFSEETNDEKLENVGSTVISRTREHISNIVYNFVACGRKQKAKVIVYSVLFAILLFGMLFSKFFWVLLDRYYLIHGLYFSQSAWRFILWILAIVSTVIIYKTNVGIKWSPIVCCLIYEGLFINIDNNLTSVLKHFNIYSDFLSALSLLIFYLLFLVSMTLLIDYVAIRYASKSIFQVILSGMVVMAVIILTFVGRNIDISYINKNITENSRSEFTHDANISFHFDNNSYSGYEKLAEVRVLWKEDEHVIFYRTFVFGKDINQSGDYELDFTYDNSQPSVGVYYDIIPSEGTTFSVRGKANHNELVSMFVSKYDCMNQVLMRAYYNPDGTPLYQNGEYSIVENDFDKMGYVIASRYYDEAGNRVLVDDAYFEIKKEYDGGGNVCSETYYNIDREPVTLKDGYSQMKMVWSGSRLTSKSYFDENGNPVLCNGMFHEVKYDYDKNFNQIYVGTFGIDNKPVNGIQGCAAVRKEYNHPKSFLTDEFYYDENGLPKNNDSGFSHVRYDYTDGGIVLREEYLDENDSPINTNMGYAVIDRDYSEKGLLLFEQKLDSNGKIVGYAKGLEYDTNGNVVTERYYNTSDNTGDTVPALVSGYYSIVRYAYDRHNRRIREEYYNAEDNLSANSNNYAVIQYEYDQNGRMKRATYYDENRSPVLVDGQYCAITYGYDGKGYCDKESYFGFNDAPVILENGISTIERVFDDSGSEVCTVYYGTDGERTNIQGGYSEIRRIFDSEKRCISESYYARDGRPINLQSGQHEKRMEYDANGNVVSISYFDKEGKAALLNSEYSEERSEYDDTNKRTKVSYFNEGKRIKIGSGYSSIEYTYDNKGNNIRLMCLDESDNPVAILDGYASIVMEYNEDNQEISRTYLDLGGGPCILAEGYATQKNVYDATGMMISRKYCDQNDRLVNIVKGYAEIRYYYDECKRVIRQEYYDENENKTLLTGGQFAEEYSYDRIGYDWVNLRYFDSDNKPIMVNGQYAGINRKYNNSKRVYKEEYVDVASKPVNLPSGYSSFEKLYDERGNMTQVSYFDKDENPVNINGQYYLEARTYDSDSNMKNQVFYTVDGEVYSPEK